VLSVLAHPDDAEFLCAGTLLRLVREHRWQAHIASMTPGDCGSAELPAEEISRIRRAEGARAAALLGGRYHCLEERDLLICYGDQSLERVTRLLREVRPTIVLTHSPADYMLDHEMTSTIVRAAAFAAPVPNFRTEEGGRRAEKERALELAQGANAPRSEQHHSPLTTHHSPLTNIPHLYYCDPIEGKDLLGRDVEPGFCIDVSKLIDAKADMLASHASQREWLLKHHGMDQYLEAMREWGRRRGRGIGAEYAE